MATLVLSTVGTALGGPAGGAIGALLGQSLDQQLLSPASRGPRLGDLAVQTSSYGTQIPRLYGSMRVAGCVIWATDLVEGEQTTGAKGQPDVVYSYSVSLAVALSSRPIKGISRIWADGKLVRDASGTLSVPTTFRFCDGSEAQAIDPLIASLEGIENTPAYRGLALAIFENLELAMFGNRIPFFTFEVIADDGAPGLPEILSDASDGRISSDCDQTVVGYAGYGPTVAAAVEPLVSSFDVRIFDSGVVLRPPADSFATAVASDELGARVDGQPSSAVEREDLPARAAASTLRLSYYDPAIDYQSAEARASAGEEVLNESRQELAAVLDAGSAKALAHSMLARRWSGRTRLTLRLPPSRLALEPGTIVRPGSVADGDWIVERCTVEGFTTIAELRPDYQPSAALSAEAGRIPASAAITNEPVTYALIDIPDAAYASTEPRLLIAASSRARAWTGRPVSITTGSQSVVMTTAPRKAVLGRALTVLGAGSPQLIDTRNTVDVELIDAQQWLTSCGDDELAGGANMAVLGSEVIQFGAATALADGRFRLSRLMRGRAGTAWEGHAADEVFCLLDAGALRSVTLPASARGARVLLEDRDGSSASVQFGAESVRPLSPVGVNAVPGADGTLVIRWTRRSRHGMAWIDDVDAPLAETREIYGVTVTGTSASLALTSDAPEVTLSSAQVGQLGSGAATIEVRQIGDWAASRPTSIEIQLS